LWSYSAKGQNALLKDTVTTLRLQVTKVLSQRHHVHDATRCASPVQAFDTVGWLDLTAAKVRFGLWLGGVLPSFTPWEDVFDRRPTGAPFGTPLPPTTGGR